VIGRAGWLAGRMLLRALALAACAACAACSGPARNTDLAAAEEAERRGDVDAALAAYREAQTGCPGKRPSRQQRQVCADAYLHHAELLERAGRLAEAAQAYAAVPAPPHVASCSKFNTPEHNSRISARFPLFGFVCIEARRACRPR
jgi:hypothetical protein